jgi:hypothetical protein
MLEFEIGDRVYITDTNGHPWAGHSGEIVERFEAVRAPTLDWTIELVDSELGSGHRVAAASSELRPERRRSRR